LFLNLNIEMLRHPGSHCSTVGQPSGNGVADSHEGNEPSLAYDYLLIVHGQETSLTCRSAVHHVLVQTHVLSYDDLFARMEELEQEAASDEDTDTASEKGSQQEAAQGGASQSQEQRKKHIHTFVVGKSTKFRALGSCHWRWNGLLRRGPS
jgi:hypothetical protein